MVTTLLEQADAEFLKAKDLQKNESKTALKKIEHLIKCGSLLAKDKNKFPDDWKGRINARESTLNYAQAQKIIRVAVHGNQAKYLAVNDGITQINSLCSVLPKANEDPLTTYADVNLLSYVGSKPGAASRNSDDWQTPGEYINAAREVMKSIALDPFSSVQANETIAAVKFFTPADDAFTQPWDIEHGGVWMNPPYGRGIIDKACERFLSEYQRGAFSRAIVLTNSATDTQWFHAMAEVASAVCFTKGRIQFVSGDKETSSNTKGQVFFYFNGDIGAFKSVFMRFGRVYND